ncbi:C-type lectin-like domain-containing protein [Chryseobacterium culicis]|uniref:C-type lectin domain-containing protein n=1 Tax=Chryseobacterium culicis TaxID=680127 RepID=A0A1H6H9M2_CHRCI|nr:C-type lectin domain-containing protein [Chryseobacterium culicis]SEH32501.1 hypothetical protein SAMN05421593_1821 [Chryseobacterium culicis]
MKNKILLLSLTSFLAYGQVGINTTTPKSTFEINGSFSTPYKLITTPSYNLLSSDQYLDYRGTSTAAWLLPAAQASPNLKGRIYEIRNESGFNIVLTPNGTEKIDISNTQLNQSNFLLPSGYYAVLKSTGNTTGSTWAATLMSNGITTSGSNGNNNADGFDTSILGYIPSKASQRLVPTSFGGSSVTELGCKKWSGTGANGHTYCAYQLGNGDPYSNGKTFYDTFIFAKQVGGYIVTLPSNAERNWVYNNILASGSGYTLLNNIWIGYNKVSYPGNSNKFTWITGEDWTIDWTTSPNSTPQSFFYTGEPNNANGTEGSCHIFSFYTSNSRQWNDVSGSATNNASINFNQVVLEFNED